MPNLRIWCGLVFLSASPCGFAVQNTQPTPTPVKAPEHPSAALLEFIGDWKEDEQQLIGMETKTSFNGTWGTDAKWHKIFYKDIKAHEMFTGTFEAEKTIKFHENPVPDRVHMPCEGIDC